MFLFSSGKSSIKKRIIANFLAIMFFAMLLIVLITVSKVRSILNSVQLDNAKIVTTNLAIACSEPMMSIAYADPMMSGESDRLTKILLGVKSSDKNVEYVILLGNDGKCIASSKEELKDKSLNKTNIEIKAFAAKEFEVNENTGQPDVFETAIPVVAASQKMGVLRIGYTTKYISAMARNMALIIVLVVIVIVAAGSIIYNYMIEKGIIEPLGQVMVVAQMIADGNLSQKQVRITSNDEIGRLADIFNKMLAGLGELVTRAELIANGMIGSDTIEEKLEKGITLSDALASSAQSKGDLAVAFDKMQGELRKLTIQARRISTDDLNNPLLEERIAGELGEAFNQMTFNLKELAKIAEQISNNDLSANVMIHSDKDVLGKAFFKMVSNLKNLIGVVVQLANTSHNSASSMAESTKQVNQTMDQVQNSIQQIASATNQVAKSTQEISVLMRNANNAVNTGSDNINKVIDKFGSVQNHYREYWNVDKQA